MPLPYWAQADLENRVGAEVVRQTLDDNNDNVADAGPLAQLQQDADSFVEGYLRGIYDLTIVRQTPPNQVKRMSLDAATMMLAKRHPELLRLDWASLEKSLKAELEDVRKGLTRLDVVGPPEPAANQGGEAWDGGGDVTIAPNHAFIDGLGDF